jgi:outer membrane protein TolC
MNDNSDLISHQKAAKSCPSRLRYGVMLLSTLVVSGCATFSPDNGMTAVANITGETIGKDAVAIRTSDDAERARGIVQRLLKRPLSIESAVQVALLNNRGLQAAYNRLALAEADLVQQQLPPNPVFSVSRIAGDGAMEVERQVVGDILALATLPASSDIAQQQFQKAQLQAALETLRLAADVRRTFYRAVAFNELVGLLTDAKSTAESTAQLARKLGQSGAMNKLDQAREQVFYAETTTDLAVLRQTAASARERLVRLLGMWNGDIGFRLPDKLPAPPRQPPSLPGIEVNAVEHHIELQIARIELATLAKSLNLTEASRFITMLEIAGIDRSTREPGTVPFRERGFDLQFQIPIFDGGEVRVRQAAETYNLAYNRLTQRAVNVRSMVRDAFRIYRSTYEIANHYQREVLPLRKIISDELQLRFGSMQIDVFALLMEARLRITSMRAAIEAKRNFWLAQSDLQVAINGGGQPDIEQEAFISASASGDGS